MAGTIGGPQLGGMDLEHLEAAATVARVPSLLIRRAVVLEIVKEIKRLRALATDAAALVAGLDANPTGEYDEAVCELIDRLDEKLKAHEEGK